MENGRICVMFLRTATQSLILGRINVFVGRSNWAGSGGIWPVSVVPFGLIGRKKATTRAAVAGLEGLNIGNKKPVQCGIGRAEMVGVWWLIRPYSQSILIYHQEAL